MTSLVERYYPAPLMVNRYDVVCDASDNIPTRYLLNDACTRVKKPLVSASALGWEGQVLQNVFISTRFSHFLHPKTMPTFRVTDACSPRLPCLNSW